MTPMVSSVWRRWVSGLLPSSRPLLEAASYTNPGWTTTIDNVPIERKRAQEIGLISGKPRTDTRRTFDPPNPNEAKDRFFRLSEKIGHRTIRPVSPRNRARITRAAQSVGRGSNQHLLGSQLEPPEGRANLAQRLSARYDAQKRPSQGETTEIAPHLVKATGEVHARGDGRAEVTLRTAQDQVGL